MLPTLVPIPRRVRLRSGRFGGPRILGHLLQLLMVFALYEVVRPLWVMFCLCTQGHDKNTLPATPWSRLLGFTLQKPLDCLVQIVAAGVVLFVLRWLAEVLVWRGQREKELLVNGRAMNAAVTKVRSRGNQHWFTYSFVRDGKTIEQESRTREPKQVGDEVVVLFSLDYSKEMLYDQCRYQLARS